MTRAFTWTEKRDGLLATLRRQGLSMAETARAIGAGCEVEHVRVRLRELGIVTAPKRVTTASIATVPRPVARPRPGLIDISKAPSSMEAQAEKWAGRE